MGQYHAGLPCGLLKIVGLWACGPVGLWAKRTPSKENMCNCAFMMERMCRNLQGVQTVQDTLSRRVHFGPEVLVGETLCEG